MLQPPLPMQRSLRISAEVIFHALYSGTRVGEVEVVGGSCQAGQASQLNRASCFNPAECLASLAGLLPCPLSLFDLWGVKYLRPHRNWCLLALLLTNGCLFCARPGWALTSLASDGCFGQEAASPGGSFPRARRNKLGTGQIPLFGCVWRGSKFWTESFQPPSTTTQASLWCFTGGQISAWSQLGQDSAHLIICRLQAQEVAW